MRFITGKEKEKETEYYAMAIGHNAYPINFRSCFKLDNH
jgi:hypothetical protein